MRDAVYVPLPRPVQDALFQLARQELRDPRLQARLLVEAGLRQAGMLVIDRPDAGNDEPPWPAA
jgi:hypothetical protein